MKLLFATLLFGAVAASPALADQMTVQVADQRHLGRITMHLPSAAKAIVRQQGTRVVVTLPPGTEAVSPNQVPRNVVSLSAGLDGAQFELVSGAHIRTRQNGRTLTINVLDPKRRSRDGMRMAVMRPNPARPVRAATAETSKPAVSSPSEPSQDKPNVATVATAPPTSDGSPGLAGAATEVSPPSTTPNAQPPSARFLAGPDVGVAAFRLADLGVVVFDEKVDADPDAGAGDGPALHPAVQRLQHGTMLTFKLAEGEALSLRRTAEAWTVTLATPNGGSPAAAIAVAAGIQYKIAQPGRAMAVSDPVSGQIMLIGTTREANGEHALIDAGRAAPGYVLLPTWLGIAIEPSSDKVDLKTSLAGYMLEIADRAAINRTATPLPENQFSIPVAPTEVLAQQLNAQIAGAAAAPPRSRGPDRVAAARTMLALGLSAETEALVGLAAADDPVIARDPAINALAGVAAVLAGRPAEAAGLDDPTLPTDGDVALWRGLRDAALGKPTPGLGESWPLLAAYPDSIRRQIAPTVLEAAAQSGVDLPATALDGPSLAIARALRLEHEGQVGPALLAFDAVENSRDERDSVRAAIASTELRLSQGQITPEAGADKLERNAIRWRGDEREMALRLRVAQLRTAANQWRPALDSLRQTEQLFPDAKPKIAALKAAVFRSLLATNGPVVNPLDLVAIAGDFADCLPDGADGDRMAGLLADKLAALDLPSRAIPVLQRLIDKADAPTAKTEYALRLAQMQIDAGEPAKADAVLSGLDMTGAAPERTDQRTMLLSRAKAARGDFAGAASVLTTVQTTEADDLRADLYARAGDWPQSLQTLAGIAARTVPETGELDEPQQALILREATAAVQASDTEALQRLARYAGRIKAPRADLFRVLTATAVRSPEDLPRAARELAMSRALPDRLDALKLH